tara:strand:- start:298 stop:636 length:339 start_codon:yes stop_codon:yes gene_type:complete
MLRAFGLILIGFGLFVQSAAHASMLSQEPIIERQCDELPTSGGPNEGEESPCDKLGAGCLVSLGCIAPMAIDNDASEVRTLSATRLRFAGFGSSTPGETGAGPEPPPPQAEA